MKVRVSEEGQGVGEIEPDDLYFLCKLRSWVIC